MTALSRGIDSTLQSQCVLPNLKTLFVLSALVVVAHAQATVALVSATEKGAEGNDYSYAPTLSADGRYVGFYSLASNFKSNDVSKTENAFLKDLQSAALERI